MKTLLIVEDENSIRRVMVDMLESNFKVIEAEDGKQGLELALEKRPDIILLDLLMPNMGGQEMLQELRSDPLGKDIPVVVLTNQDDTLSIASAHQGGLTDYIIKSNTTLEELKKKVKAAILTSV